MSKGRYTDVINKARNAESGNTGMPENGNASIPESQPVEETVNLTIKVSKSLRRHWLIQAKREDTSLTAAITGALRERFGAPEGGA